MTTAPLAVDVLTDATTDAESVASLEAAGYDGVWTTETVRDPFLTLVGYAARTDRMRLGTGVAIAFARSPMTLALTAHDLQRLSGGRLILGLGSQVKAHIERRFSMPWSEPAARMREYVLALRAIWATWNDGSPLDFRGRFTSHTLMTPFFDPGPTGFGPPPVVLGGVGERMTAVAGEVADGFLCAQLTSERTLTERTLPALGATGPGFLVCAAPFVVTGQDPETMARVEAATRKRIAFYASTPAYRAVLDVHGWAARGEELTRLSKAGEWDDMATLVDDEMLHAFAVVAEPDRLGAAVHERWAGRVDRVAVFTAADPGAAAWPAIIEGLRAGRTRPDAEPSRPGGPGGTIAKETT
jgi:probable F420-dependent oxidoreductase